MRLEENQKDSKTGGQSEGQRDRRTIRGQTARDKKEDSKTRRDIHRLCPLGQRTSQGSWDSKDGTRSGSRDQDQGLGSDRRAVGRGSTMSSALAAGLLLRVLLPFALTAGKISAEPGPAGSGSGSRCQLRTMVSFQSSEIRTSLVHSVRTRPEPMELLSWTLEWVKAQNQNSGLVLLFWLRFRRFKASLWVLSSDLGSALDRAVLVVVCLGQRVHVGLMVSFTDS